ncbi:hypothetical protein K4F52_006946 [Lecanicillium sp. MT-2017a]|nr:hypothetical protein K4F52_006946 [Lecanicillium sp. MT-2017a]
MKFTQTITAAILAATSVSAAPAATKSNLQARGEPANVPDWIIENMKRVCAQDDSSCTWTFKINPQVAEATDCTYYVETPGASRANGGPVTCGDYQITSGWDASLKFTTVTILDVPQQHIAYPSWSDTELEGGKVQGPKYAAVELPWHP